MNFFFKVKLPFLQWNLKIVMNYLHFLSAKQSCTAQWGQWGHTFQVLRKSLMCTDFLLLKVKSLHLHLDCRAGVLFSSSHMPQPSSSAWEGSATQVPPSLLCSSPGKSEQGKQWTPGILPGTGTACGQQISQTSWDRCNREWMNPAL